MDQNSIDIPIKFKVLAHESLMNVLWTGTMMKRAARTFFKNAPITEAEFNLLMILRHSEKDLSQNDLSERLLVDKSNVTALIDRLQRSKMIKRNIVPGDRRRYHIVLTESGKTQIDALDPIYHQLVSEIMSGLTEKECTTLINLTRKVRTGLRSTDTTLNSGD